MFRTTQGKFLQTAVPACTTPGEMCIRDRFYEQLQALEAAAAHNDEGVVKQLAAMIPTFTPTRENLKL